jgi:ATP-dependent helicase HrpB
VLPVVQVLPALTQQLLSGDAILVAPPGAGKSTYLPLELLKTGQFSQQKIIMLQPRRIAVRNIARYLAQQLNEPVGQTIGYRIRGENKTSAATKLEIVTEGILTRMLQSQPELPGIGLVIFDEFHERSIHADFSLALCLEVQQALREDLRLLVMSATLDVAALTPLMPAAKVLHCEGRSYPIDIVYKPDNRPVPLYQKVCRLVLNVVAEHQKDILVFLPGAWDIRQAASSLEQSLPQGFNIHCLFGELSKSEQQAALMPNYKGLRKIVLATNIAETSLTIEGIEVVVDSGMQKTAVFQLSKGITHLQTTSISQASAIQRAGRAGRLGPGSCYRLWSGEQQDRLAVQSTPEILSSDMAPFILEANIWGCQLNELALIDMPSNAQLQQGKQRLLELQAIDSEMRLQSLGREMHALGCHPAIANMLLKSLSLSSAHQSLACALASILESKDPLTHSSGAQLYLRLQYLQQHRSHSIWLLIKQWHRRVNCKLQDWPLEDTGRLLAFAFPHWIGRLRQGGRYQLANGSGAELGQDDPLAQQQWIVVGDMLSTDKQQGDVRISLAESLSKEDLERYFSHLIYSQETCFWDQQKQAISAQHQRKLGHIVMSKTAASKLVPEQVDAIWRQVILDKGVMQLPFEEEALQLIYRLRLAAKELSQYDWPDMSEQGLQDSIEQWLLPYLQKMSSWQQLSKLRFVDILNSQLEWAAQKRLNDCLPSKYLLPTRRHAKLNYSPAGTVQLSVRMQEMYGQADTPELANGRVKLQMELLSPAGRPLQTTQDLAGFWQGSYRHVQKEMKGRYPRHFWPDNPANALPTDKTKKKMNAKQ